MNDIIATDDASTPLTHEELEKLKLSYITNREELNEAEQANILDAQNWVLKNKRDVLSEKFFKELHKRMFSDVWKWAGKYRDSPRNIGIDAYLIPIELNALISDVNFWIENRTYSVKEIAVRLHHKLVFIHPFPNGNGRWGRLVTDVFLKSQDMGAFSWGDGLGSANTRRKAYVSALRAADQHDFKPLLRFVGGLKMSGSE